MSKSEKREITPLLFYLHGQIVEGSDGRPHSAIHGYYEYRNILTTFANAGFQVKSEIRPAGTDVVAYAQKIASQIEKLLADGVPEKKIVVVGASKGGMIAAHVSHILKRSRLRFVIVAGLFPSLYETDGITLHGEVLSIHDKSDNFPIEPELFFDHSPGLTRRRVVITDTGLGHGLLYQPYPIWVGELLEFVGPQTGSPRH